MKTNEITEIIWNYIHDSENNAEARRRAGHIIDEATDAQDEFTGLHCEESGLIKHECHCTSCIEDRNDYLADLMNEREYDGL
jgi:hypothetical protein